MAEEFKPQYTFTDDRLNELKQLFPEAWEDGVFNVDTLKTLIGEYSTDNNIKEHFGLNWVGKQDARKIAAKPPTGTLKPCPGEGVNEDNTENIFIEGENLEVLKILRKSYMGKIKMIYIDPPYNTGNDFIYNDSFADSTEDYLRKTGDKSDEGLLVSNPKSSGKYHANWLSFMYPRLRLAKDLLKEDGVIFISIDDHEIENLRLMCDEIFGEENFICEINREAIKGGSQSKNIRVAHDYVLAYSKNSNILQFSGYEKEGINLNLEDDNGFYAKGRELNKWGAGSRREDSPSMWFPIKGPNGEDVYPIRNDGSEGRWRLGRVKMHKKVADGDVIYEMRDNGTYIVYEKIRDDSPGIKQFTTLFKDVYTNAKGTEIIKSIYNSERSYFDYAKPVELMYDLMVMADVQENDIVLDFFAGSSATAHASIKYAKDFEINCGFILCQIPVKIPENHISRTLGFDFITNLSKDRIIKSLEFENSDLGFKVFKQNKSTIYKWQDFIPQQDGIIPDLFSKLELAFKNPLLDGTDPQDFITEIILQEGFPLTAKKEEAISGVFKITHEWVPYNLYVSMLQSFKNIDLNQLQLQESDHFICLDKAFESNDALKQAIDNKCKLFTI